MNNQIKKYILLSLTVIILIITLYGLCLFKKQASPEPADQSNAINNTRTFIEDKGAYVFSFKYPENWIPRSSHGLFNIVTFMNSNSFDLYAKESYSTNPKFIPGMEDDLRVFLYPNLDFFIEDKSSQYTFSSSTDLESFITLNKLEDSDTMHTGFKLKDKIYVDNKPAYYIELIPDGEEPIKSLLIEEKGSIIMIYFKDDATAESIIPTLNFFERPNW
jgi:hypothetical protein